MIQNRLRIALVGSGVWRKGNISFIFFLHNFKGDAPLPQTKATKLKNILLFPDVLYLNELSGWALCFQCTNQHATKGGYHCSDRPLHSS